MIKTMFTALLWAREEAQFPTLVESLSFLNSEVSYSFCEHQKSKTMVKGKFLIVFILFILPCSNSFGQSQEYQKLSEEELTLLSDLNMVLDTTRAIIYPFIEGRTMMLRQAEVDLLTKDFGFTKSQLSLNVTDKISLKDNGHFKVIDNDSILKFRGMDSCKIEKGKTIYEPFLYYTKLIYNRNMVRFFKRPIISLNKEYAIVQCDDYCGMLCGSLHLLLMQQRSGKWSILKVFFSGMS